MKNQVGSVFYKESRTILLVTIPFAASSLRSAVRRVSASGLRSLEDAGLLVFGCTPFG